MRSRTSAVDSPGVQLSTIITPMLDMAFQILAFFIMTYHPSSLEAHIPGALPENDRVHRPGAGPVLEPELEVPVDPLHLLENSIAVRLEASRHQTGDVGKIYVRQGEEVHDEPIADADRDSVAKCLVDLRRRMVEIRSRVLMPTSIRISADGEIHQGSLVKVYDACKQAGFATIQFIRPTRIAQGR